MATYELRSFKKPLLRGHTPIPLEPPDKQVLVDIAVGEYYDPSRGKITEQLPQMVAGDVIPIDGTLVDEEATHLFNNPDCWQVTINEYVHVDDAQKTELRGTPHWCASIDQIKAFVSEVEHA